MLTRPTAAHTVSTSHKAPPRGGPYVRFLRQLSPWSGLSCDLKAGRCVGPGYALLLVRLAEKDTEPGLVTSVPRVPRVPRVPGNVTARQFCPNHEDTCEEDQTCCPLPSGDFGCCPLGRDAVCCSDKQHCCPHNTVCNLDEGSCSPKP